MHEYKPRGIVKWAPFAALTDYTEAVHELYERLEVEELELRNSDFGEYLSENLNQIIVDETNLYLKYEQDGQIKEISGIVTALSPNEIEIGSVTILISSITDILL